jgi:SOS response regulatory protein OraA/RecX
MIDRCARRSQLSTSTPSSASTSTSAHARDRDSPYEYEAPISLSEIHRRRNAAASKSSSSAAPARRSRARAPPPSFSLDIDDNDDDDDEAGPSAQDEGSEYDARARERSRPPWDRRRPLGGCAAASVSISSPSTPASSRAAAAADDDASAAARKVTRALNSAAGSLSRRPHSRAELERKLHDRGHSPEAARPALEKLRGMGLLPSDREFARSFARAKFRTVAWAPSRIRTELVRGRGVSPEDAVAALRDIFGADASSSSPIYFADTDEEDDEADRLRGEKSDEGGEEGEEESRDEGNEGEEERQSYSSVFEASWDPISRKEQSERLLEAAERQAHLSRGLPLVARRRRLAAWLARRGHGWKTASAVMERVGL